MNLLQTSPRHANKLNMLSLLDQWNCPKTCRRPLCFERFGEVCLMEFRHNYKLGTSRNTQYYCWVWMTSTCCASWYSILADTPVVWVLIIFFAASDNFQSYLYLTMSPAVTQTVRLKASVYIWMSTEYRITEKNVLSRTEHNDSIWPVNYNRHQMMTIPHINAITISWKFLCHLHNFVTAGLLPF